MEENIRIIYCPANSAPEIRYIPNTLEAMQRTVGGLIEMLGACIGVVIVCNEEARILGMPPNQSAPFSGFVGDVFICGIESGEEGENFASIGDDECRFWFEQCWRRYSG